MLSEKDLMIDDWVMYDPNVFIEDEYVPAKECYPTKIETGEDIDSAVEGCYYPIPITPEILEKNGFEYMCDEYGCWLLGKIELREREPYNGLFEVEINIAKETTYIHYVHELQHALRLCVINKTFEL